MSDFDLSGYLSQFDPSAADPNIQDALSPVRIAQRQQEVARAAQAKSEALDNIAARRDREVNPFIASFGLGSGRLVENFGILTGGYDGAMRRFGSEVADYWEQRKPNTLVDKELKRSQTVAAQNGELAQGATAFWETVKDPEMLLSLVMESVPSLAAGGVAGRAVGAGARALGAGQQVANRAATAAALGEAGAEQGASVAGETYDELLKLGDDLWDQNADFQAMAGIVGREEAKRRIANKLATRAGMAAGAVSLASQKLPGGSRLERSLAGTSNRTGNVIGNVAMGLAGEATQEAIEEGSGVIAGNVAKQQVDAAQGTFTGVGEAAGLGAAAGGVLGGVTGAADTRISDFKERDEQKAQDKIETKAAVKEAEKTGKVDELLANNKNYEAAQVALNRINDQELTEDERNAAEADLARATTALDEQIKKLESDSETTTQDTATEEKLAAHDAKVERAKEAISDFKKLQDAAKGDSEAVAGYQKNIDQVEAWLRVSDVKRQNIVDNAATTFEQDKRDRAKEIETLKGQQIKLDEMTQAKREDARPPVEEVESLVKQVESEEDTPERAEAVDKVIKMGMRDPGAFDEEDVGRLAQNPNIPEDAREMFQAFTDAQAAANSRYTIGDVKQQVEGGREGFQGLSSYIGRVGHFLKIGDTQGAIDDLNKLKSFAVKHEAKLAKLKEARAQAQQSGRTRYLERQEDGSFVIRSQKPWSNEAARQTNGGFYIAPTDKGLAAGSRLIEAVELEVTALNQTGKQLAAAVRLARKEGGAAAATQSGPSQQNTTTQNEEGRIRRPTRNEKSAVGLDENNPPPISEEDLADLPPDQQDETVSAGDTQNVSQDTQTVSQPETQEADATPAAQAEPEQAGEAVETETPNTPVAQDATQQTDIFEDVEPSDEPSTVSRRNELGAQLQGVNREIKQLDKDAGRISRRIRSLTPTGLKGPASELDLISAIKKLGGINRKFASQFSDYFKSNAKLFRLREDLGTSVDDMATLLNGTEGVPYFGEAVTGNELLQYIDQALDGALIYSPNSSTAAERQGLQDQLDQLQQLESEAKFRKAELERELDELRPAQEGSTADTTSEGQSETAADILAALDEAEKQDKGLEQEDLTAGEEQSADYVTLDEWNNRKDKPINWFTRYFTQKVQSETSQRPLAVANFMSEFIANAKAGFLKPFLSQQLQQNEREGISHFKEFWETTVPGDGDSKTPLMDLLKLSKEQLKTAKDYPHRNLLAQIRNEDDSVNENVATAIAYAAYHWLASAPPNKPNSDKEIKNMLGVAEEDQVDYRVLNSLRFVGVRRATAERALGRVAAQALGYVPIQGAPSNLQTLFETALGQQAMAVLMGSKLLTENSQDILWDADSAPVSMNFVKVAKGRAEGYVKTVGEIYRESDMVIDDLFRGSRDFETNWPQEEPEFKQRKINNSNRAIPEEQRDLLNDSVQNLYTMEPEMAEAREVFTEDELLLMAGFDAIDENDREHEALKGERESRFIGMKRELTFLNEWRAKIGEKLFALAPSVKKQQRVHFQSTVIDPQGNKSQRFDMSLEAWKTRLTPGKKDKVKLFRVAVAQGLGIKVDKMRPEEALKELDEILAIEEHPITKAIEAARGNLEENKEDFIAGVLKAGEDMHSFRAIIEMARFLNHDFNDPASGAFETRLSIEVDGVANGAALSQIALGAAEKSLGAIYGFFTPKDDVTNFPHFAESGSPDIYERLALAVHRRAPDKSYWFGIPDDANMEKKVPGTTRKIFKDTVIPSTFGAGLNKVIGNMAHGVIGRFYLSIEEIANSGDTEANQVARMNAEIKKFNDAAREGNKGRNFFKPVRTSNEGLKQSLTDDQAKWFVRAYQNTVGEQINEAMDEELGPFLKNRTILNQMANSIWARYNAAFQYFYQQRMNELIANQQLPLDNQGNPLQELSATDMDRIRKQVFKLGLVPIVHTAMSSGGTINAGLDIEKVLFKAAQGEVAYQVTQAFGVPVPIIQLNGETKASNSRTTYAQKRSTAEPGVAILPMLVHAMDSAIASRTYGNVPALNVHDALFMGLDQVNEGATLLNENTFSALANYSIPLSVNNALEGTYAQQAAVAEFPGLTEALAAATISEMQEVAEGEFAMVDIPVDEIREGLRDSALEMEQKKLQFLQEIQYVNQYGWTDGVYEVTDKDIEAVNERLAEVETLIANRTPSAENLTEEGAEQDDGAGSTSGGQPAPPSADENPSGFTMPTEDYWEGKVGRPLIETNEALRKLFAAKPNRTVKEILWTLRTEIKNSGYPKNREEFLLALVNRIGNAADVKDLPIYVVEKKFEKNIPGRGEFTLNPDGTAAGIELALVSSDLENSGLNLETVIHELVHAATARLINAPEAELTADQKKARNNLKEVYKVARAYVYADAELKAEWAYAVKDLDEMVAYGMTNLEFQQEVLMKAQVSESVISDVNTAFKTKKGLLNAFGQFVRSITDLVFGRGNRQSQYTGMYQLMVNAPILFSKSSKLYEAGRQGNHTKLSMGMSASNSMTYTSEQIFDALERNPHTTSVSNPEHRKRLKDVLKNVVDVMYEGDSALREKAHVTAPVTADDVFLQAKMSGQTPFAGEAEINLTTNDQEAFVMTSVELAVSEAMQRNPSLRREMERLYREARAFVKPADLPKGEYEFLFKGTEKTYLSRFAAAAIAYEPLVTKLSQGQVQGPNLNAPTSLAARVANLFARLLAWLDSWNTKVNTGDRYDVAVGSLANRMASVEVRTQRNLERRKTGLGAVSARIDDQLEFGSNKIRNALKSIGEQDIVRNSPLAAARVGGAAMRTVFGEQTEDFIDATVRIRNRLFEGPLGFIPSVFNEARGVADNVKAFAELGEKASIVEQTVLRHKEETTARVKAYFGQTLSERDNRALANLLRTDMSVFVGVDGDPGIKSINEIRRLLINPNARDKEVSDYEQALATAVKDTKLEPYLDDIRNQAKALAYFQMTGIAKSDHLMLNAYNIVTMRGTTKQDFKNANIPQLLDTVDRLTSLYALNYMDTLEKSRVARIIDREFRKANDNEHGVATLLRHYKKIQNDAAKHEFRDDPTQMIKGYTPDIVNPYIETAVVDEKSQDEADLLAAGYSRVGIFAMPQDPDDPSKPKVLYSMRGRGLGDAVAGIMGGASKRQKGTYRRIDDFHYNVNPRRGLPADWDPREDEDGPRFMVPTLRTSGSIKTYRYIMEQSTRDRVLERNNDVAKMMGQMAGKAITKRERPILNEKVVRLAKQDYDAEYVRDPAQFMYVGKDAKNPEVIEAYKRLPRETQKYIKRVFKKDGFYIRKTMYEQILGYRKWSLADQFAVPYSDRSIPSKIFSSLIEGIYGKNAARRVMQAEDIWLETVKLIKDIWVIRNVTTLFFNEMSNAAILMMYGINPIQIAKDKVTSFRAVRQYRTNEKEISALQTQLDMAGFVVDPQTRQNMVNEIDRLTSENKSSPVHEVVQAGFYTTVVEEIRVNTEDDPYSYQSRLMQGMSKYTSKVPQGVKNAANEVFLNHGSAGYTLLKDLTMLSDFSARYALHKHLTSETNRKQVSKEESLRISRAAFVNYDIPTHRGIQYLNDMGFLPFTKYYIRIQRALFEMIRSNPGRALMMYLGADMMDALHWTPFNSSVLMDPLPGSLSAGAPEIFGAVGEIGTFAGARELVEAFEP